MHLMLRSPLALTFLVAMASVGAIACEAPEALPHLGDSYGSPDPQQPSGHQGCVDEDKDGFGPQCLAGSDCDDDNDSVTNECYRCLTPQEGCECEGSEGAVTVCGKRVSQIGDYVSCVEGERTCAGGVWGPCSIAGGDVYTVSTSRMRTLGQGSGSCDDLCDPNCRGIETAPESADDIIKDDDGAITIIPPGNTMDVSPNRCEDHTAKPDPIEVGIVFVVDMSGSMRFSDGTSTSRWNKFKPALTNFFNSPNTGGMYAGLEFFPDYSGGGYCSVSNYRDLDVPIDLVANQRSTLIASIDAQSPAGGTPLLYAARGGLEALTAWLEQDDRRRGAMVLVSDGDPSNSCGYSTSTEKTKISEMVSTYFEAGVQTFVMGLDGANSLGYLNSIGKAGSGDAREAFIISTSGATAAAEMEAALMQIRASFLACEYSVPPVPDGVIDPNETTLDITANGQTRSLNMVLTPGDCGAGDGFYFDAQAYEMLLCPTSCDFARSDADAQAEIIFSCKSSCTSGTERAKPSDIDLFLMVDRSGSMGFDGWENWNSVKLAISGFAHASVDDGLGLGISYFPPAERCEQPRGTKRSDDVERAMRAIRYDKEAQGISNNWYGEEIVAVDCQGVLGGTRQYFHGSDGTCDLSDFVDGGLGSVPIAALTSQQADLIDRSVEAVWPQGATPMRPALEGAIDAALKNKEANSGRQSAVILATDGQPTACTNGSPIGSVVDAATNGRDKGIDTYVIGIGNVSNLDQIAHAGSGTSAFVVAGGDQSAFSAKLQEIRELVSACNLGVPAPPQGRFDLEGTELVITDASGRPTTLPRVDDEAGCGSSSAWYYDDNDSPTMINLCPEGCALARAAKGRTDVLYQCIQGVEAAPVSFTYDSSELCPSGHTPTWTDWSWTSETAGASRIEFEVATGDTLGTLSPFYPIQFTGDRFKGEAVCASSGSSCAGLDKDTTLGGPVNGFPLDAFVKTTLEAHGLFASTRFLQIRATLYADDTDVPRLLDYEQRVTCVPSH